MARVLLVGNGAREHAIAEAVKRSTQNPVLFSYMSSRNPGIIALSESTELGSYDNPEKILEFVSMCRPDFAVIGPEAPLQSGFVDALEGVDVPSVGPYRDCAKLETSKSFTRNLMKKHDIPGCPEFMVFRSMEGIREFISGMKSFVVKPDGLTGGKGVKVHGEHLKDVKEGLSYCEEVLKTHSSVIVEEKLEGEEFSLQCFTDGRFVLASPPVQDHKRAFDGDRGPNTGGMGSYSCNDHLLPFLEAGDVLQARMITEQVSRAIQMETGMPYKGVMYGGFIRTADGVRLIEYNARMGDPEAMNVLPIMKTDFIDLCYGIIHGNLNKVKAEFDRKATVCKYVVPEGYPDNPKGGQRLVVGDHGAAKLYYASVDRREDGLYMSGSRALAFVGISDQISEAERIAQQALKSVKGPVFFRSDIGTESLLKKRVDHMRSLMVKK